MTLQQLGYFLAAVRHGSFSAAAAALHMAQPSLSDQIRRLEAELGVALFARAGRKLELTEAGRLFLPGAERTLASAEEAEDAVRGLRTLSGGTASFGTFGSAHHYLLSELVQDFRARHPGVRVRVVGQNSSEVADAVRDGSLEGGLITLPVDDRGLELRPSIRDEILYVGTDPTRVDVPVTIERLVAAPLILYDARWGAQDPMRRLLDERAQRAGLRIEPEIEVEYLTAALELAIRGAGDTLCARTALEARGYGRRLLRVSLDPPLYDTFAFVTRRGAHLSPATRAFMELAEERITRIGRRLEREAAAG
jgi:LysR family transcriptional regulator, cyn operon transcriptional activator